MVRDSHRLDDILTHVRRLFSRADVKMQLVDLNNVVDECPPARGRVGKAQDQCSR